MGSEEDEEESTGHESLGADSTASTTIGGERSLQPSCLTPVAESRIVEEEEEEADAAGRSRQSQCFFIGSPPADPRRAHPLEQRPDSLPALTYLEQALEEARLRARTAEEALVTERQRYTDLEADCRGQADDLLQQVHAADQELMKKDAQITAREEIQQEVLREQQKGIEEERRSLEATLREVLTREARLEVREQALEGREQALEGREGPLERKEAAVQERLAGLEVRDAGLGEREAGIEEREARLKAREARLEAREARVQEGEARLREQEAGLEEREASLQRREAAAQDREEALAARELRAAVVCEDEEGEEEAEALEGTGSEEEETCVDESEEEEDAAGGGAVQGRGLGSYLFVFFLGMLLSACVAFNPTAVGPPPAFTEPVAPMPADAAPVHLEVGSHPTPPATLPVSKPRLIAPPLGAGDPDYGPERNATSKSVVAAKDLGEPAGVASLTQPREPTSGPGRIAVRLAGAVVAVKVFAW